MATTTNQEYIILHGVWRKALEMGTKGLTIPCNSEQAATRLRFALYASVREFRRGRAQPDQKLADAISEIALSMTPDKKGIIMQPKAEQGIMPMLRALVGEETRTTEEIAAEEQLQGMVQRLMSSQAEPDHDSQPSGTPYYTRS